MQYKTAKLVLPTVQNMCTISAWSLHKWENLILASRLLFTTAIATAEILASIEWFILKWWFGE